MGAVLPNKSRRPKQSVNLQTPAYVLCFVTAHLMIFYLPGMTNSYQDGKGWTMPFDLEVLARCPVWRFPLASTKSVSWLRVLTSTFIPVRYHTTGLRFLMVVHYVEDAEALWRATSGPKQYASHAGERNKGGTSRAAFVTSNTNLDVLGIRASAS